LKGHYGSEYVEDCQPAVDIGWNRLLKMLNNESCVSNEKVIGRIQTHSKPKRWRGFNKLIWQLTSPKGRIDDARFGRSAASFDNHQYRDSQLAQAALDYSMSKAIQAVMLSVPGTTKRSEAEGN